MKRTLIETVRVRGGRAPLWPLHLDRLATSCAALEIATPELIEPRGGEDRVVRFEIRTGGILVSERPVGPVAPLHLHASLAPHRGYRHKTADRAWLQAARSGALISGADDALLFTEDGTLVEATRWAVGWWEGEWLCFPPLTLGGLPSVARARLAETARGGLRIAELSRLLVRTRPLLACNAARGVVPVFVVDQAPLRQNHRTMALQDRFWNRPSA